MGCNGLVVSKGRHNMKNSCLLLATAALATCAAGLHAPEGYRAGSFDADFVGLKFGDDPAVLRTGTETVMNLRMLNDTTTTGAVCLDGSPGGFYFSAATSAANVNDWQIYFQGGGWCYDEKDCWHRSNSHLGTWRRGEELRGEGRARGGHAGHAGHAGGYSGCKGGTVGIVRSVLPHSHSTCVLVAILFFPAWPLHEVEISASRTRT